MNYSAIYTADMSNGPGVRVSFFVSGCRNHCEGCFNPETWDFNYGKKYTENTKEKILRHLSKPYIRGLTVLGGEPMEEENQPFVLDLLRAVYKLVGKDIILYTGYLLSDLQDGGKKHTEYTDELISYVDVLIDGPYIKDKACNDVPFIGSTNQLIHYFKK